MKRLSLIAGLLLFTGSALVAEERPTRIRGARALGMGDAFTAVADDQNIFFYNPAGSTQRTGSLVTLFDLPITINQDAMDAFDFIDANQDKLEDFDALPAAEQAALINEISGTVSKLDPRIGLGFPNSGYVSGPIGSGWHWGSGVFGQVEGGFRINASLIPYIDYDVNVDAVVPVNIAKRWDEVWLVPGKLCAGVNLKFLRRGQIKGSRVSFLQLEDYESPPVQVGRAFGVDAGLLYQPNPRLNLALAALKPRAKCFASRSTSRLVSAMRG